MSALFESPEPESTPAAEPVPSEFPKIVGAEIAASTFGQRVAGDFYDSFRVGKERVLFGLLDVAGRRENNQPILAAAQKIFRTDGAELFAPADLNESEAMTALCLRLNRGLMEVAGGVHSCPAFIGCYHERFGTLCYTNAGHTPGLLRDRAGIAELSSTGLPLGLFSHATADAPTVGLEKGAVLLLVSRGVVEGKNKANADDDAEETEQALEQVLEPVKDRLKSERSSTAQEMSESILNALGNAIGESASPDDMTALVLLRTA
jgi:serine phosphatase RsbU (regulator of sigma subunit)